MNKANGLEFDGVFSPWLRFCIGVAILMLAAAPLILAIKWW